MAPPIIAIFSKNVESYISTDMQAYSKIAPPKMSASF